MFILSIFLAIVCENVKADRVGRTIYPPLNGIVYENITSSSANIFALLNLVF